MSKDSKSKSSPNYLDRHRARHKTSVPPDDSKLTQSEKTTVADEQSATLREGARQAIIMRDEELARAQNERMASDDRGRHEAAVKRAHDEAAEEPTKESATQTFRNWMRKLWDGG